MESRLRSLCRIGLGAILVGPLFAILLFSSNWQWPALGHLIDVLWKTTAQSFLSSIASMILGLGGALGLLHWQNSRFRGWLEVFCLLPGFLPALFVILPVLNLSGLIGHYPFGLRGIVLVHTLMCAGLVAVTISRLISGKLGGMVELAWVEGASRWSLVRTGLLGYLRADLALLAFYVFALCFASFAVPLIMGGLNGQTIEVLIYEKIRQGGGWSQAFVLSLVQMLFLFGFSLILSRSSDVRQQGRYQVRYLTWIPGLVPPILFSVFVLTAQFSGLQLGIEQLLQTDLLVSLLPELVFHTLLVGVGTGIFVFILLLLVAGLSPHWGLDQFLTGYASPSAVVTGFAFLLFGFYGLWGSHLAMILGLGLLFLPGLYRLMGRSLLHSVSRQVQVARVAGASWTLIFWQIEFPQVSSGFLWLAGLAAFWACGDFALSSIVAESSSTLGLMVKGYMTSYRLELATVLNLILICVSSLCFLFFGSLGFVVHKKSLS